MLEARSTSATCYGTCCPGSCLATNSPLAFASATVASISLFALTIRAFRPSRPLAPKANFRRLVRRETGSSIMRPYKPAPKHKNASANRIRERYLHQLGLQRGIVGAPALAAPESNHVVVISGLPSLPEDRATTEHVMESHDFSISKHSQHTGTTPGESSDANSSGGDGHDEEMSDAGGSARDRGSQALGPEEVRSHCSKSTLSASPGAREGPGGGGPLTHMALAYPTSLLSVPSPAKPLPPPSRGDNCRTFPPSRSVPWGSHALSKPASVLLDSAAEYRSGNDHDSVSSAGTSTTAESSFNAAMVSRDWGTGVPSSQAGSPASNPGVHFQLSCGHGHHPRVRAVGHPGPPPCAASSLSHALHRFNLDSDCEASSVASNSVADDAALVHDVLRDYDDEASWDDAASHHSHASAGSSRSQRSSASHHGAARKKIGKTQRLMDRAAAHDRILRVRSDRSREMRANVVHHQRMSHRRVSISGISSMMTAPSSSEAPPQLSESPCSASTCASQASVTLMHVNHGSGGSGGRSSLSQGSPGPLCGADLGRTPTASNCSDLRRALRDFGSQGGPYSRALRDFGSHGGPHDAAAVPALPAGVHLSQHERGAGAPLVFHPRLASRIPTPPPAMVLQGMQPSNGEEDNAMIGRPMPMETETVEAGDAVATLEHTDYNDATATVDDVLEVAVTLSKLGGGKAGPVPRIR
ncbi:hypothetical protein ACHAWF_013559 [Thalassiosira exigua]